jgi:hypothetical protein
MKIIKTSQCQECLQEEGDDRWLNMKSKKKDTSEADIMSARSMLSQASLKISESKDSLFESYCKRFELGALANSLSSVLTQREQCSYIGTSAKELVESKKIAKHFDNDILKFRLFLSLNRFESWKRLSKVILKRRSSRTTRPYKLTKAFLLMRRTIDDYKNFPADVGEYYYQTLKAMAKMLSRVVPFTEVIDKNFLKYSDCCGCGEEAWGDGHKILYTKTPTPMPYPMCDKCIDEKVEVDMSRVASIYYIFSKNIETAYQNKFL